MKDFEKKWEHYFDLKARHFGNRAKALGYQSEKIYYYRRSTVLATLHELFYPLKGMDVLDCGCGNGLFTKPFVKDNRVTGIDISEEMLKIAEKNGLKVRKGSVLALPFENDSFDIVISAGVVQHLDNAKIISSECARVVKPGGIVLIETINNSLPRRCYRALRRKSAEGIKPYKTQEVVLPMEKAGLQILRIVFLYYPFTYRRTQVREKAGMFNRLFSSAFVVVGRKEAGV
jgi:2-polyprenyl-3-methyl-5-hydroxy-6-metoxy-1,4-benzoquinol methylase